MAVKYKVEYGKDVYEQAGLGFADLLTFGTIIQPKMAGLIAFVFSKANLIVSVTNTDVSVSATCQAIIL